MGIGVPKPMHGWRAFWGKLGLPYDRAAIRNSRKAFLDLQRGYRGTCVDALPLDAGFDGPVMGERPASIR